MIRIVCLYGLFAVSGALLLKGPCDLEPPRGSFLDLNFTSMIHVPKSCTNGTFVWHYPAGNTYLLFKNYGRSTAVCFWGRYEDDAFKIYDATPGHKMTLLPNLSDKSVCTTASVGPRLKIRINARGDRYMGQFAFFLKFAQSSAPMSPL